MKFSVPHKRELTNKEKEILTFLFEREKKDWVSLIGTLKVIARCGCENCPIVFFGKDFNDKITDGKLLIDYFLKSEKNGIVGISIFGNKSIPSQLEFYSVDGLSEITEIPSDFKESEKVIN